MSTSTSSNSLRKRHVNPSSSSTSGDGSNNNNSDNSNVENLPNEIDNNNGKDKPTNSSGNSSSGNKIVLKSSASNRRQLLGRLLQVYSRFSSSALNQDKLLKIIAYSLWMLARFYSGSGTKEQQLTRKTALLKLSGDFTWARFVTRFLGLPAALEGVQSGSWVPAHKTLGKAMALSMVFYYPLEHLSYLKWKVPEWIAPTYGPKDRLAERACAWSCRFWMMYVALDVVRSVLALSASDDDDVKTESTTLASKCGWNAPALSSFDKGTERLQILRNAFFALPVIHWSLPNWDTKPLLTDTTCNTLLWLEAVVCMYQSARSLRKEEEDKDQQEAAQEHQDAM